MPDNGQRNERERREQDKHQPDTRAIERTFDNPKLDTAKLGIIDVRGLIPRAAFCSDRVTSHLYRPANPEM